MAPCMSSILALSVSDKIEQYGAYAGFASVLGLAVLSLLYFAQAREVKRLREWAGRSPERAAEQQERATAAAQQRVVAQPQRPAPAPAQPGQPLQPGQRPAAATPAGQAAGAPAAAAATAAGAAGAAAGATATQTPPAAPAAPATPGGQPTTAMPAANGAAASAPAGTPPAARPGQPLRVPPSGPPGSNATRLQDFDDDDEPRSRTGLFAAIGAIVVVLIVAVVLITGVLGGSDDNGTQPTATVPSSGAASNGSSKPKSSTTKTTPSTTSAPKPGTYEVSVLNGTTVPGLARGVANRLQNNKYKIGNVTNAATQDRSATLVEYAPGHRAEADQVAKAIDVGSDSIQPLTDGSKTIAGDTATVVVTVGSDQNVSPQSNGTATGTTTG
jgi:hypothetical protein